VNKAVKQAEASIDVKTEQSYKGDPRFEEFLMDEGGLSFTIEERRIVKRFYISPDGGWYDESYQYFNADGIKCKASKEVFLWSKKRKELE